MKVASPRVNHQKKIAITFMVVLSIIVLTIAIFSISTFVRDHLVDKPLAPGFVYIQQDIVDGWLTMPTQTFYYATDVPPDQFASKFAGWKLVYSDEHSVRIDKDGKHVNAQYYSYAEYPHGSKTAAWPDVDNFKGKKYIVYIHGASMYFLNPDNIDPSMKQHVLDEIKSTYTR